MSAPNPVSMERLAEVGASHVCDVRGGEGALDGGIRPVWRGPSFAGPARTVIAPAGTTRPSVRRPPRPSRARCSSSRAPASPAVRSSAT